MCLSLNEFTDWVQSSRVEILNFAARAMPFVLYDEEQSFGVVVCCPTAPRPELNFESKKRRRAFGMEQYFGCNFAGSPALRPFFCCFRRNTCGAAEGTPGRRIECFRVIRRSRRDMCCGSIAERAIGRIFWRHQSKRWLVWNHNLISRL
jgi:hypothetical protein